MDLHSGAPYWLLVDGLGLVVPPLGRDAECDVAVIGGGITGALVCDSLTRSGHRVVLLEKNEIGLGSTVASTALLQYDTDQPLYRLEALLGHDAACRVYRIGEQAVLKLLRLASELGCPGERLPSLYLCTAPSTEEAMRHESELRRKAGLECRWLTCEQLQRGWGIRAHGAILSPHAGAIDPYRACQAMLRRAIDGGAVVCDRTAVTVVEADGARWRLQTSRDHSVLARLVVHATGYESAGRLPHGLVTLHDTYVIASEPTQPPRGRWNDGAVAWEHADPYLYCRWERDRLLVGGEDEPFSDETTRESKLEAKARMLVARMAALAPDIALEPAFAWAGTFATTRDSLGYVGELPGSRGNAYALGFGGNGITFSALATDILTAWAGGQVHPDAALFAFDRPTAGADEP
jgi:glycine/D-amino acid oxidase-like deaminating enzyme